MTSFAETKATYGDPCTPDARHGLCSDTTGCFLTFVRLTGLADLNWHVPPTDSIFESPADTEERESVVSCASHYPDPWED